MPRRSRTRPNLTWPEAVVIDCVHEFFKEEKRRGTRLHARTPSKRTAKACGVSRRTVFNAQRLAQEPVPDKGRKSKTYAVDDFLISAIRGRVRGFFLRKELPTVSKVLRDCEENIDDYPGFGRTMMWKTLKKMGFRYSKRTTKRQLYERQDVIAARAEYLRTAREYRSQGRPIFYLDETWCNQHHTVEKVWQDDETGPKEPPSGKGKRLIILHAGSEHGWVPGADLVFVGKKDTRDYHGEMNSAHFEEWWEYQLLPNLPPAAVVVLDNAPYHNRRTDKTKAPTSSTKKAEMIEWLASRGIAHNPASLKAELYQLVKRNKPKPEYVVDQMAADQGVDVVRLPVGHCELNPIELVWANVKTYVAKHNTTFKMADVRVLVDEGLAAISPEYWSKCYHHAIQEEDTFWEADNLQEEAVEALIINIPAGDGTSSSEGDDDFNSESDED